jgi:hypothetical protein
MSPIANTSGCPGSVQSGRTATLPVLSVSAPVCCASMPASGEAWTPAAQMRVRVGMTSFPPGPSTVMLSSSMSVARVFTLTSTPMFSNRRPV